MRGSLYSREHESQSIQEREDIVGGGGAGREGKLRAETHVNVRPTSPEALTAWASSHSRVWGKGETDSQRSFYGDGTSTRT